MKVSLTGLNVLPGLAQSICHLPPSEIENMIYLAIVKSSKEDYNHLRALVLKGLMCTKIDMLDESTCTAEVLRITGDEINKEEIYA